MAEEPAAGKGDVAQQLANPIASLISVPLQFNYDENLGVDDEGSLLRVNVQPVIPVSISDDWNMISRTIVPVVNQRDTPFSGYSKFGLSDTVQSLFFSPKAPTASGWIWGVGPVLQLPTTQLVRFGGQLVQIGAGVRYWAASPAAGAEDWGFRFNFTMVFPE